MPTPPPAPILCVLAIVTVCLASFGCGAARRPDSQVARAVEREERRLAAGREERLTALAAADLASIELASAGLAIEALALLYVPHDKNDAPPDMAAPPADPDWVQGPPPSWVGQPWPDSMALDIDADRSVSSGGGPGTSDDAPVSFEAGDGRRRRKGGGKPKLRMDLLNWNIRGRPVSFSASLKGLKGVQFKATIKM